MDECTARLDIGALIELLAARERIHPVALQLAHEELAASLRARGWISEADEVTVPVLHIGYRRVYDPVTAEIGVVLFARAPYGDRAS